MTALYHLPSHHLTALQNGNTPLHLAARNGLTKAVVELCNYGADVNAINAVRMRNASDITQTLQATLTALHVAAREGHIEVVRALCVAGADISATTKVRLRHTTHTNSHLSNPLTTRA